jgi:major membrane immunogen (membrane-anchored lipoprotein)
MQRLSACAFSLFIALGFTACKAHEKKIWLYASSDIQMDNTKTNITVSDGTTHHEQELDFPGSDPVTLNVQAPQGKLTLNAADDGLYIANLKNDTVIGSFQHVGAEGGGRITQEALKQKLDSLQKLVQGQNVSDANRNYFIPPGKIVKISTQVQARVFGPFTTIPGSFDAGSVPEVYKFYSIKELREIIANLQKMSDKAP